MKTAPARRVESFDAIERPGDYCGPVTVDGHADVSVWALLPTHPEGVDKFARPTPQSGLIRVASPPHTFVEHEDGSLEVQPSIGVIGVVGEPYTWHGYLRASNVWEWDE